jgi:hypothetical protein
MSEVTNIMINTIDCRNIYLVLWEYMKNRANKKLINIVKWVLLMNVRLSWASTSRFGWSTGPIIRMSMATDMYTTKEIKSGMVKYFTANRVEVRMKHEPMKQAKYVFICKPPPKERIGINRRKKKMHSGSIPRNRAIIMLHRVLADSSKKH